MGVVTHKCIVCGVDFPHRSRAKDSNQCCSRECGFAFQRSTATARAIPKADRRWIHWYFKTCEECGNRFRTDGNLIRHTRVTCSEECKRAGEARAARLRYTAVTPVPGVCIECGAQFCGQKGTLYCSVRCAQRVSRRAAKFKRKTRYRNADVQSGRVTFQALWEATGGRCYICGGLCFRSHKSPHPLAPTIDHKVSIAKGGQHLMENAGIAHAICNSFKSDRALDVFIIDACKKAVVLAREGRCSDAWGLYPRKSAAVREIRSVTVPTVLEDAA
jgi:hypothetical protein